MPENVLIIDNDQEASNAIAGALESEGFLVFTASRAETGLLMAKRIRPALLFLNLSVAGGIEFAKKLKAVETLKEVPFVLLLEGDAEYDPGYATMYGIMNYIVKPVNPAEAAAKSRVLLKKRPAPDALAGDVKEELPLFMEKKPVVETPEEAFSPAPHPLPLKEESAGHFVFEAADREGETEERPAPAGTLFIHHRRNLNKKNMALVVALIFLGASASFGYFYFLAPKRAVLAEIVKVRDFFKTGPRAPETDKGRQDFTVKTPGLRDLPVVDKSVFSGLQNVEEANTKAGPVINSTPEPEIKNVNRARKTAAPPRPQAMTTITKSLAPPGAETKSPEHFHSVQLGVFSAKANADKVLRSMKDKGYQAFITEAGGKKRLYRVLVGRFRTEREAGALLAKIKDRENFKFMPVLFYE